jgi:phosphatidylglycerophosphate synthase
MPDEKTSQTSTFIGFRKFFLCLVALILIFVGVVSGNIDGSTGSWSIVAIVSLVVTGYAGEYFLSRKP